VAVFREVHYKEWIHGNIREFFEPMYRYKILNFKKIIHDFKIHIKD